MTDISKLKIGDRVVVDTHRRQGERYEHGVITGLSAPGWVYYRPDGNGRVVAEDPSNVRLEEHAKIHLTITETEPAAWQRYDEGLGWSPVDESYAKTLAAGGVTVRRLYAADRHIALVEKIAGMRLGSELADMGFAGLAHEGVFAAFDAVIVEARALTPKEPRP